MKAIAYLRCSSDQQADSGLGLEAQEERCRAYCLAQGWSLVRVFKDAGVSGGKTPATRPGLAMALKVLGQKDHPDALVVLKLDRASRSTRDVLDLVDRSAREGWRLVSVSESLDTGTPGGRMVVTVLASMAQMERELGAERTRIALDRLRKSGKKFSGVAPYGIRYDGDRIVDVPEERQMIADLLAYKALGIGFKCVARVWNECGRKHLRGDPERPWSAWSLRSILRTVEAQRKREAS